MDERISVVRGAVTIAPGPEWVSVASTWPVLVITRTTQCPDGCAEDHVHGTRRRAHEEGVYETPGPLAELHLACARCPGEPSVMCLSPDMDGAPYHVCSADMLSGITAHIRRSHPGVVSS